MRADQLLVGRRLASTLSQAQRLIAGGVQWRAGGAWKKVAKNGDEVPADADIQLLDDAEARYVSRGGLKLEAALKAVGLLVQGLAQPGSGPVHRRLHRLPAATGRDPGGWAWTWAAPNCTRNCARTRRVVVIEAVNARNLTVDDLMPAYAHFEGAEADADAGWSPEFDLIVGDLSFIRRRWCCRRCCPS